MLDIYLEQTLFLSEIKEKAQLANFQSQQVLRHSLIDLLVLNFW